MSNYTSFIQKLLPGMQPPAKPAVAPVSLHTQASPNTQNPFMIASDTDNPQFMGYYGVNRPLKDPMFLGYRDNKALMGGSRLFILY